MAKVLVVFMTASVSVKPDTKGPLAGLPKSQHMTYSRKFDLDYMGVAVGVFDPESRIPFYGRDYHITSCSLDRSRKEIGILVTEEQLTELLRDVKSQGHRLKKKAKTEIDARSLVMQIP